MSQGATKDDVPEFGPHMLELSPKRQAFVCSLYHENAPVKGEGLLLYAARQAGYGNAQGTSSNQTLSVIAHRIAHDPKVLSAISEYSKRMVRAISPEAVRAVREAVRDPSSKDHIKAAAMVLDRSDPITAIVKIEDDRAPPSIEATERVIARINELAVRAGLPPLPAPSPVIDGVDYEVVTE